MKLIHKVSAVLATVAMFAVAGCSLADQKTKDANAGADKDGAQKPSLF
ncbi:hypothetical protein [Arcanobacterium hippocoleae]